MLYASSVYLLIGAQEDERENQSDACPSPAICAALRHCSIRYSCVLLSCPITRLWYILLQDSNLSFSLCIICLGNSSPAGYYIGDIFSYLFLYRRAVPLHFICFWVSQFPIQSCNFPYQFHQLSHSFLHVQPCRLDFNFVLLDYIHQTFSLAICFVWFLLFFPVRPILCRLFMYSVHHFRV